MPLANWTNAFNLTSAVYAASLRLPLNQVVDSGDFGFTGIYYLRPDGCNLRNSVRSTKENVPQADGAILHCRYLAGMEMDLAIQLWESSSQVACDCLLEEMLDKLMGYLYGLENAGDNEGRISWAMSCEAQNARMLDDIRLLSYPVENHSGAAMEITVTVDCALPYSEDLTQLAPVIAGPVANNGNRPTYPVWRIDGPFTQTTLTNSDTGESFTFDGTLPGSGGAIVGGEVLEIDTFTNKAYVKAGSSVLRNAAAGIVMTTSDFFSLLPGTSNITLSDGSGIALVNAAWA